MKLTSFMHDTVASPTTLSEIKRIANDVSAGHFFGVFAYATQSGSVSFDLALGEEFWSNTKSQWLFGIDYGRTQPQALRRISEKQNAEVRIVDGSWVVDQKGFVPRRDFHAKMALLLNFDEGRSGMVVGSGNFSSNGLRKSIEAGASVFIDSMDDFNAVLKSNLEQVESLWSDSTPVLEIIDDYQEKWSTSFARKVPLNLLATTENNEFRDIFWIEAGYVTKNRGAERPGNQIDFPRGISARYFGFNPPDDLAANSVIGRVKFETPFGGSVSNNLRLGNNMMEKISLPIPEVHGFDIYDGKILVFRRSGIRFAMRALEADDFETAFGDKLDDVRVMGSGRRYGFIL